MNEGEPDVAYYIILVCIQTISNRMISNFNINVGKWEHAFSDELLYKFTQ